MTKRRCSLQPHHDIKTWPRWERWKQIVSTVWPLGHLVPRKLFANRWSQRIPSHWWWFLTTRPPNVNKTNFGALHAIIRIFMLSDFRGCANASNAQPPCIWVSRERHIASAIFRIADCLISDCATGKNEILDVTQAATKRVKHHRMSTRISNYGRKDPCQHHITERICFIWAQIMQYLYGLSSKSV